MLTAEHHNCIPVNPPAKNVRSYYVAGLRIAKQSHTSGGIIQKQYCHNNMTTQGNTIYTIREVGCISN